MAVVFIRLLRPFVDWYINLMKRWKESDMMSSELKIRLVGARITELSNAKENRHDSPIGISMPELTTSGAGTTITSPMNFQESES